MTLTSQALSHGDGEDVLWDELDAVDEFGPSISKFVKLSSNQDVLMLESIYES